MRTREYLFVGGSLDGQKVYVNDRSVDLIKAIHNPNGRCLFVGKDSTDIRYEPIFLTERYVKQDLRDTQTGKIRKAFVFDKVYI